MGWQTIRNTSNIETIVAIIVKQEDIKDKLAKITKSIFKEKYERG